MSALSLNAVSTVAPRTAASRTGWPAPARSTSPAARRGSPGRPERSRPAAASAGRSGSDSRRRPGKAEEEQEAADEERRVVRVHDCPGHEDHVDDVTHAGTGSSAAPACRPRPASFDVGRRRAALRQRLEFAAERDEVDQRRARRWPAPRASRSAPSMNGVSQSQGRATISTGGAAKWVSVPPIDTLTNSRPSVAYFSRVARPRS